MERPTEYPGTREKIWSLPFLPRTESKAASEASTRARSKSITVRGIADMTLVISGARG
jgi:hypothetical protein